MFDRRSNFKGRRKPSLFSLVHGKFQQAEDEKRQAGSAGILPASRFVVRHAAGKMPALPACAFCFPTGAFDLSRRKVKDEEDYYV